MTEYDPIKLLQMRDAALEDRLNALAERISSVAKQVADLIVVVSKHCVLDVEQTETMLAQSAIREQLTRVWDEKPAAIHG